METAPTRPKTWHGRTVSVGQNGRIAYHEERMLHDEVNVTMGDPRFWRELFIRGGMTLGIAAIGYFILDAGPVVWLIPVLVSALVAVKWLLRPKEEDEEREDGQAR